MKSLKMTLIVLLLTGLFGTQANARDRVDNAVYIETVDAGMRGYPANYPGMGRDSYDRDRYRHGYHSNLVCREIIEVVRGRHGRYREVIRTICRDRDDWHRPHHRGQYPNPRYEHNERW